MGSTLTLTLMSLAIAAVTFGIIYVLVPTILGQVDTTFRQVAWSVEEEYVGRAFACEVAGQDVRLISERLFYGDLGLRDTSISYMDKGGYTSETAALNKAKWYCIYAENWRVAVTLVIFTPIAATIVIILRAIMSGAVGGRD